MCIRDSRPPARSPAYLVARSAPCGTNLRRTPPTRTSAPPRRTRSGGLGPDPHLEDPAASAAVRDRLTVQHGHPAQLPVQPRHPVGAAHLGGDGAPPAVVVVMTLPLSPLGIVVPRRPRGADRRVDTPGRLGITDRSRSPGASPRPR